MSPRIADERAIKESVLSKGAGGFKFCLCCANAALPSNDARLPDPTGYLTPGDNPDASAFQPMTSSLLKGIQTRLREAKQAMGPDDFKELELEFGFSYNQFSVLQDPILNVDLVATFTWDWCHCLVISGALNNELWLAMKVFSKSGVTAADLDSYLNLYTWPQCYARPPVMVECFNKDGEKLKATASELISLVPVLAVWLQRVVAPRLREEHKPVLRSLLLLCRVIQLCTVAGLPGRIDPAAMTEAVSAYLGAHNDAYGAAFWVPKMHFIIHLGAMLAVHGLLLNTLVCERKHKEVKRLATGRTNTTSYDLGMLKEMTVQHISELSIPLVFCGLLRPYPMPKNRLDALKQLVDIGNAKCLTSATCMANARRISHGDVCTFSHEGSFSVGEVYVFFSVGEGGEALALVNHWNVQRRVSDAEYKVLVMNRLLIIRCSDIITSVIHSQTSVGGVSTVLRPIGY